MAKYTWKIIDKYESQTISENFTKIKPLYEYKKHFLLKRKTYWLQFCWRQQKSEWAQMSEIQLKNSPKIVGKYNNRRIIPICHKVYCI